MKYQDIKAGDIVYLQTLVSYGWHGNFDQAYVSLAQLRVRLIDADTLADAIKVATTIGTEMTSILKEAHMGE